MVFEGDISEKAVGFGISKQKSDPHSQICGSLRNFKLIFWGNGPEFSLNISVINLFQWYLMIT